MVDWNQIDTVLLDMDGTLLDLHFDNYFWLEHVPQRYAEIHNVNKDQAQKKLMQQIEEHRGSLNWYCLDYWSEALQLDIPELKREIQHKIQFRPQVKDFLAQLKRSNKRTWIVTNAHRDSINLKLKKTALDQWVDQVLCSHDFQLPKENPEFWHQLHQQQPFEKESTLLIDDSLPVLRSAKQHGIRHLLTILQPDSQQPRRTLDEFPGVDDFSDILLEN